MTPRLSRVTILRALFVALLLAILVLSLLPAPDTLKLLSWQDKIEHFMLFAGLTWLGLLAWQSRPWSVAAGILVYGVAMELAQSLTAYRVGDFGDWIADAIGVAAALGVVLVRRRPS